MSTGGRRHGGWTYGVGRLSGIADGSRVGVAGMAGLAYAVLLSFTHPFTWAADLVTAVPLAAVAAATIRAGRGARRPRLDDSSGTGADRRPGWGRRWWVWIVPLLATTGWELYCLVSLPRLEHPTLSSLIDLLDSSRPGKIAAGASWLALGWFLVTR